MESLATWFVNLLLVYTGVGIAFAVLFAARGAGRIDPSARGGTWGFRLLLLPGAAALWPFLALRWLTGAETPPAEDNPHRRAARELEP